MKYMLDTNICIYLIKGIMPRVLEKFATFNRADVCISSIVLAELEFGACKSANPAKNRSAFQTFLKGIEVLPFDTAAAIEYGYIRADLERRGTPIGANDLLIAAHAKSLGLPLVTNNIKEFERVDGLTVETWA